MKLETLHDLYIEELRDLYSAERQLVDALPKMRKAASSPALRAAFEEHLAETLVHIERLDKIFKVLDASPKGNKCEGMGGLLKEGKHFMKLNGDASVIDAGLIAQAQRGEHYEMAGYGCARTYARLLGFNDAADALQETLNEEGAADKRLTELAEGAINLEAAAAAV